MKKAYITIIVAIFVVYAAIVVTSGAGLGVIDTDWNFENSGQFGDSFGPLSAIFSCAAAICAFLAYRSQAEEVKRIKESAEVDRKSVYRRDFENTFFKMTDMIRQCVRDMDLTTYKNETYSGTDVLNHLVFILWNSKNICQPHLMSQRYSDLYKITKSDLPHYFRMCYHLVKFIDESEIENKKLYIRIFRATLSNAEMVLIGLNAVYGGGKEKFRPLVEKYALLHNISSSDAIRLSIFGEIDNSAFGDRDIETDSRSNEL